MNWLLSRIKGDIQIWLVVFLLTIISIIMVYSSTKGLAYTKKAGNTEYYLIRQITFIIFGLLFMFATHKINYKYFSRIAQILLYISFPLLLLTYIFGPVINQAQRWLVLPGTSITFQTSDLAKIALIMFIARTLSRKQEAVHDFKKTILPLFGWILALCAFIAPSDLSTAILLFISSVILMFIGRVQIKYLLLLGGSLILMGFITFQIAKAFDYPGRTETWVSRIESYLDGEQEESYQSLQANIAISRGELFGKMPGGGRQKNFLPSAYSDFIYAIIIEETGLIGGILIILLYLYLLFRSIRIVINAPNAFGALLAVGLSISLVLQAFVNMGVATGLLPVTGLTLPFISMGGTSLLFTSISLGIILSVSRYIEENQANLKAATE